jgi:hypothetical protein
MAARVYVLKVSLKGTNRIWRRIAILGDQTLDDFHDAIYEAFDRYEEHLYSFYFPKPGSKGRQRLRDATEYTHPYNYEENPFADESFYNAAKTRLDELGLEKGQEFEYLFDFGDSWWHKILVEETEEEADGGEYPRVIEKRGKSPAQYEEEEEEGAFQSRV